MTGYISDFRSVKKDRGVVRGFIAQDNRVRLQLEMTKGELVALNADFIKAMKPTGKDVGPVYLPMTNRLDKSEGNSMQQTVMSFWSQVEEVMSNQDRRRLSPRTLEFLWAHRAVVAYESYLHHSDLRMLEQSGV